MEHRVQKLNNPDRAGIEGSLPSPIEPSRVVPSALPKKQVSNTSSDSEVNSPHTLPLALIL